MKNKKEDKNMYDIMRELKKTNNKMRDEYHVMMALIKSADELLTKQTRAILELMRKVDALKQGKKEDKDKRLSSF